MVWNYNFSGMLGNLFLLENSCFDAMCLWQCWTMANVIFYTFSKGSAMIDVLSPIYGSFSISYHQEMSLGLNVGHGLTIAPSIYTYSTYCNMVNTHIMHLVSYKCNKDHLRWISSKFIFKLFLNYNTYWNYINILNICTLNIKYFLVQFSIFFINVLI